MHNYKIFGTSYWSLDGHVNAQDFRQMGSRIFFGINAHGPQGMLATEVSRHLLSVGPTRAGKGASLIITNLLKYDGSVIVIDPKGENAYITAKSRRRKGQKTFIIDPCDEVNRRYGKQTGHLEQITNFNPLDILDPTSESNADDLAYIADALIINQGSEPHWADSARELMSGLIAYTVEKDGVEATLPNVRSMLQKPLKNLINIAIDAQEHLAKDSLARRKLGRFANLDLVDSREIQSIVSTALSQTGFLDSPALGKSLSSTTPGFSFGSLLNEGNPSSIYLVLPVDKLNSYNRWLRLLVSIAIRSVARSTNKTKYPVLFLLDELGSLGHLPVLPQAYSVMAGMNMLLWGFVQDLTQLVENYPRNWELFINNSDVTTFFGTMCEFTANYVSRRLGKRTVEKFDPYRIAPPVWVNGAFGPSLCIDMFGQLYARDLLQPEEVSRLPERQGIMLRRDYPILFEQVRYYECPSFFEHAREDPYNSPIPLMVPRGNHRIGLIE